MGGKDLVPTKDAAFYTWINLLITYVVAHAAQWNIADSDLATLQALLSQFNTAYQRTQSPNRGKADTLAKNDARAALEKSIRAFLKSFILYNPKVTQEDRDAMDIPRHDTRPSPHPRPSTYPEYEIRLKGVRLLEVGFWDQGSSSRSKPYGVQGAKLCWTLSEQEPEGPENLTHSVFSSKSSYTLEFREEERGQKVWVCLQWENSKGEAGPWGVLTSAVVP